MEVFMEWDVVAEVRVSLQALVRAKDRAAAMSVTQEDARQPLRQLIGHFAQGDQLPRSRRALDLEIVAVVTVEAAEALDQEEVDRHPDRAAPVGVPPEESRVRLGWLVGDGEVRAVGL